MDAYIFDYAVNSGLALMILFLGYRIFLYRNNNFAWSRATLLTIYTLALILPSLHLDYTPNQTAVIENAGIEIGEVSVVKSSDHYLNSIMAMLVPIYYIGMSAVCMAILVGWVKIADIIRTGQKIYGEDHTLIVIRKRGITPFSVGKFIVVPANDVSNDAIVTHELSHVKHRHFIDLFAAQIFLVFQWWNPAAWWMFRTLKTVHEYQADYDTIAAGFVKSEYQTLIVTRSAAHVCNPCADTIGSGSLRARLKMMDRRYHRSSLIIYFTTLPCAVLASAIPTLTYAKDCRNAVEIENIFISEQQENTSISYVSETETSEEEASQYSLNVYYTGEKLFDLVKSKINYPYGKTTESGKVVVQFTLTGGGNTKNVNILKSSGVPALDEEAKRVISELSMASPYVASVDGKDITQDIRFAIPISFNP